MTFIRTTFSRLLRGRQRLLGIVLSGLIVMVLAVWGLWPVSMLEIRSGEDGPVVKEVPVDTGERITYTYRHSVQKTPVVEILEAAPNGHLVVRETIYDMFGVGLPSDHPDGTLTLDTVNGKFHIVDMSRDIPLLRMRVAFTAEQTMDVHGEHFRLDSLAEPMALLTMGVVSRPRLATLIPY